MMLQSFDKTLKIQDTWSETSMQNSYCVQATAVSQVLQAVYSH